MESHMSENFVAAKYTHSSEEALRKRRRLCGVVKNPKQRFRFNANLTKSCEPDVMSKTNQVSGQVKATVFGICVFELESMLESRDVERFRFHGGLAGIAQKLSTSVAEGIPTDTNSLNHRQRTYGVNKFRGSPSFLGMVWKSLRSMTLMILGLYALFSLTVGIATEGWTEGALRGLLTIASILLSLFVTATIDYRQSLKHSKMERNKVAFNVTRSGSKQEVSRDNLLAGDIVHLSAGEQVPADGLFVSGSSISVDESILTGKKQQKTINRDQNPFLLCGSKLNNGPCTMMVTMVGMGTRWGKLMATLGEGEKSEDEETPLQLNLSKVAKVIGQACILSEVVTFVLLVKRLYIRKLQEATQWSWSGDDAMEFLEIFALAVTGRTKSGNHQLKSFIRSQVCKYAFFPG